MSRILIVIFFFCQRMLCLADDSKQQSPQESIKIYSYTLGYMFGKELQAMKLSYNINSVIEGLTDFEKGLPEKYQHDDDKLFEMIVQTQSDLFEKKAAENALHVKAFFQDLRKNGKIIKLIDQELYYEILCEGEGEQGVVEDSSPLIHYSVNTFEGIHVASTSEDSGPVRFPLKEVIIGFRKGIVGMRKKERRKLYVHPDLAYRRGGCVPPNSVLIFEVELKEF
jgi:peptidylprolyl isomerase